MPSPPARRAPRATASASVRSGCSGPLEQRGGHRGHRGRGGGPGRQAAPRRRPVSASTMSRSVWALLATAAARRPGVRAAIRTRRRTASLSGSGSCAHAARMPRVTRDQRGKRSRLGGDRGRDDRVVRVVEQHVLLGREVPEERHRRHPGRRRDLGHRRRLETLPLEQVERALQQPRAVSAPACPRPECYSITFGSARPELGVHCRRWPRYGVRLVCREVWSASPHWASHEEAHRC